MEVDRDQILHSARDEDAGSQTHCIFRVFSDNASNGLCTWWRMEEPEKAAVWAEMGYMIMRHAETSELTSLEIEKRKRSVVKIWHE